jgi:hypothetical protein
VCYEERMKLANLFQCPIPMILLIPFHKNFSWNISLKMENGLVAPENLWHLFRYPSVELVRRLQYCLVVITTATT